MNDRQFTLTSQSSITSVWCLICAIIMWYFFYYMHCCSTQWCSNVRF